MRARPGWSCRRTGARNPLPTGRPASWIDGGCACATRCSNRLIEQAVEANPSVAKAKAVVREARATVQQTAAGLFPSVSGNGLGDGQQTSAGSASTLVDSAPYTLHQGSFDSSWELDLFGGTQRSVEAAVRGEQSAQERFARQPRHADRRRRRLLCGGPGLSGPDRAGAAHRGLATRHRKAHPQQYDAGSGNAVDSRQGNGSGGEHRGERSDLSGRACGRHSPARNPARRPPDGLASLLAQPRPCRHRACHCPRDFPPICS